MTGIRLHSFALPALGLVLSFGLTACSDDLAKPIQGGPDTETPNELDNPDGLDGDTNPDSESVELCDLECPEGRVDGACQCKPREGCVCEDPDRKVCGTDGITYRSPCEAACHFAGVASEGECQVICPAIACAEPCEDGYKKDANGCDTCECLDCPPVLCNLACPDGFKKGPDGCEICECLVCPDIDCAQNCPNGYKKDPAGCDTCECLPGEGDEEMPEGDRPEGDLIDPDPIDETPDVEFDIPECRPIDCARCPDGTTSVIKYGEDGCPIGCGCEPVICPPIACPDDCPNGCEVDPATGCITGRCREADTCEGTYGGLCVDPGPDDGIRCPEGMQLIQRGDVCGNTRRGCCVPSQTCSCDLMYAPVCGIDGQTYPNRCTADCARVAVAYEGECRTTQPCGPNGQPCPNGQRCFTPTEGPQSCVPVTCGEVACRCAPGYRSVQFVGSDGCPTCSCVPEACRPVACDMFCECGFARDDRGCEICQCQPCTDRCGEGPACAPDQQCVECPIDPNCPNCDFCPPAICVPQDGCTYHTTEGQCICFGQQDCPQGQGCELPAGAPYGKCTPVTQNACQQRGGTCIAVVPGARCPTGTQANPRVSCGGLGSTCCLPTTTGCQTSADCPQGQSCVGGRCIQPPQCTSDANCPRGFYCENGRCADRCNLIDCQPGYTCQAGECILDPNQNTCATEGGTCGRQLPGGSVACPTGSRWDGGRLSCQGQPICCLRTTIGCSGSADCPDGQACINGQCQTQAQCDAARPCPPNTACRNGVCVPIEAECTQDTECPAGLRCVNYKCEPITSTCRSDADCGTGNRCVNGSCVTVNPTDTCSPRGGLCVAPSPDGQLRCPSGTAPISSAVCSTPRLSCCMPVEPQCRSDRECPAGQLCDRNTGMCVPEPRSCESVGGTCVNFSAPGARCPVGNSVSGDSSLTCSDAGAKCCTACTCPEIYSPVCGRDLRTYSNSCEAECAQVQILYNGECRAGGCLQDSDCPTGRTCDLATYTCRAAAGTCATDRECPVGQVCDRNTQRCVAAPPAACRADTDCETGERCVEGLCRAGCRTNDNCAAGQVCQNGSCITVSACESRGFTCADGAANGGACPVGMTKAPPTGDNTCAAPGAICCTACQCTRELAPVCGTDNRTYPNACYAECAGVRSRPGECPPACRTQADCPAGTLCDTSENVCYTVPASCTNSNQCPGALLCLANRCMNRPAGCVFPPAGVSECVCSSFGQNCPAGWTCENQQCAFGQCVGTCEPPPETPQCPPMLPCVEPCMVTQGPDGCPACACPVDGGPETPVPMP